MINLGLKETDHIKQIEWLTDSKKAKRICGFNCIFKILLLIIIIMLYNHNTNCNYLIDVAQKY